MIFHLISKKPVLVIGNGARSAEISELIYEFINKTHIPVLTSMNTVDMVQDGLPNRFYRHLRKQNIKYDS